MSFAILFRFLCAQHVSDINMMMAILMSETCWAHKKWNKIASDIKLVFYSSNALMLKLYLLHIIYPNSDMFQSILIFYRELLNIN